jgi:thioredoxin 1
VERRRIKRQNDQNVQNIPKNLKEKPEKIEKQLYKHNIPLTYIMITSLPNKEALQKLLKSTDGIVVLKFGAEWCGPCKLIEPYVNEIFTKLPNSVTAGIIDVDENFELYAILKRKKIVQKIPTILRYDPENQDIIPDDSIVGVDEGQLKRFFDDIMNDA